MMSVGVTIEDGDGRGGEKKKKKMQNYEAQSVSPTLSVNTQRKNKRAFGWTEADLDSIRLES